ncbi:MAG TPA: hypothetical protein VJN64_15160 [Terriglobales bacterium]|nr:hypothetical protein [Terriglobales bacterium]
MTPTHFLQIAIPFSVAGMFVGIVVMALAGRRGLRATEFRGYRDGYRHGYQHGLGIAGQINSLEGQRK